MGIKTDFTGGEWFRSEHGSSGGGKNRREENFFGQHKQQARRKNCFTVTYFSSSSVYNSLTFLIFKKCNFQWKSHATLPILIPPQKRVATRWLHNSFPNTFHSTLPNISTTPILSFPIASRSTHSPFNPHSMPFEPLQQRLICLVDHKGELLSEPRHHQRHGHS